MNTPSNQDLRAAEEARLGEIDPVRINQLTQFAERRLAAMGLPPSAGEDVTQRALAAVLRGLESGRGRPTAAPGGRPGCPIPTPPQAVPIQAACPGPQL